MRKIALLPGTRSPMMATETRGHLCMRKHTLTELSETIAARRAASAGSSYTKSLLDRGVAACAKKMGEEAVETVIAAMSESDERLCSEAADLLYHLVVLLEARNVGLHQVFEELDRRTAQSGLAEKASRPEGGGP